MHKRRLFLSLIPLCLLLISCGGQTEDLRFTGVLPTPAVPGQEVSAFGLFPAETELRIENEPLETRVQNGSLSFVIPEEAVAGDLSLEVTHQKQSQSTTLQVLPRIDDALLSGSTLVVQGAGWQSGASVTLELGGQSLQGRVTAAGLEANLSDTLSYGALSLRVVVNNQASAPFEVVRAAGAVKGKVVFPAETTSPSMFQLEPQTTESIGTENLTALLVFADTADLAGIRLEGLQSKERLPTLGVTRLNFTSAAQARAAYGQLKEKGFMLEYDLPVHTDGFRSLQADAPAEPGTGQWHLPLLGLESAWESTKGEGVVVAVIDTGVRLDHPDLVGNLLPGYDFVDGDDQPYDLAGHGTHVAGLVAANGQVLGTAPEARILPIRSLEGTAGGSAFTVAQGILWAAGLLEDNFNPNPADIINLSLGTSGYSATLASAVSAAQAKGIIVVAATGNSGGPLAYPAALPGVLSVTALAGPEIAYQPWYANKGNGVWVTGYGGDTTQDQDRDGMDDGILSTDLNGYAWRMGTSMAAPQVAGLAALALASGTPAELVRDTLGATATDLGVMGYDAAFGYGLATGRSATPSTPRSYVLALVEGEVVSWTLVQPDGSYQLDNLPSGRTLSLVAMSDEDGDAVLGESGELISPSATVTPASSEVLEAADLALSVSDGSFAYALEATP